MKTFILAFVIAASAAGAHAQDGDGPDSVSFEGADWRIRAAEAKVEEHLGRDALKLSGGRI